MKDSQRLSLLYLYANLLDYKIKIFPTDKFPKHDLEELEQIIFIWQPGQADVLTFPGHLCPNYMNMISDLNKRTFSKEELSTQYDLLCDVC